MYVTRQGLLQILLSVQVLLDLTFSLCKNGPRKSKRNVIHGRYTRDIADFHIVVPQKVHHNGSFHSHHLSHYFKPSVRKKRNLGNERVHYLLHFNGSTHILELEPHIHLSSPGMVVETRKEGTDMDGITFREPQKHLCHFRGNVRGHPGSRVALSSCNGLVGHIRTKDGVFHVEPLHGESPTDGSEHVHVVYKRSTTDLPGRSCKVRGDWWSSWCSQLHSYLNSKTVHKRSEAGTSVQRWYEVMITADKKFLLFHKDHNVEEYIMCIMNMVSDYYHDVSVGNLIDIVIVRIIYLEKEEKEIDLEINTDGEDTLTSFCKWQMIMNPKDHNHPNHHDLAILFTRYDICSDDDDTCSLLGLAHLGTACTVDKNCCINEDSGLLLGVVTTHEMGHTLACSHDAPDESGCEPVAPAGDSTVMNPTVTGQTSAWSPCSRGFITGLFDSQMGECMLDEPKDHTYPLNEMPPGAFYDASAQCGFLFGPQHLHYDQGGDKMCQKLWCRLRDAPSTLSNGEPPADGTSCGTNKWCYKKECVEIGERPEAVNGQWGAWGQWSECSRTCGAGVTLRERLCNNPQPSNKGRYCIGKRHEYNMCNTEPCDSEITFRERQCSEFDDKDYAGMKHKWRPHPPPDADPNPCALFCLNDANEFMKLAPRVRDGTRCKPGTRDTCVQGTCMPVGCDWKIASTAVEDACGICEGDGTHCTIVRGVYKEAPTHGYIPIVTVPVGATNVKLEEVEAGNNMIAVSAIDNQTFYLNGDYSEQRVGEYSFGPGIKGIYLKPEKDLEELHIKGPLKEPLVLYTCLFDLVNPGVRYSYAVPSEKPMYTPKYHWEFVEWGPCSAQCGGGTQVMKASCIEDRDGKVKESFCESLERGEPRARTCKDQPCRTRWKVWKWGPCSGCLFQSGTRTRQVECVKENPTTTGDEEIITEASDCCGEPPKKTELCNSPRPCPKNMTSAIVKRRNIEVKSIKEMISKRNSEGKSFSDKPESTTPRIIKDPVNPDTIRLEERMIEQSPINLTERQFQDLGDMIPEKILSCPIQTLKGKDAMERLEEVVRGPGYKKNITKINNGSKNTTHKISSTTAKLNKRASSTHQSTCQSSSTTCKT